jgi:pimeloyl-ACP methyl ester carboxylesterase
MIRGFFSASTTPAMRSRILTMMLRAPEATAVGALSATRDRTGQTEEIPSVPVLGIYADNSGMASRASVQAHFPAAEYTQIPGTGHFLMLEKPEEFNALLLAFLAKQTY